MFLEYWFNTFSWTLCKFKIYAGIVNNDRQADSDFWIRHKNSSWFLWAGFICSMGLIKLEVLDRFYLFVVTSLKVLKTNLILLYVIWRIQNYFNVSILGCTSFVPYIFPITLSLLLMDRAANVDAVCRLKHGAAWDRYSRKVKYRLIPYVYWWKLQPNREFLSHLFHSSVIFLLYLFAQLKFLLCVNIPT